MVYHGNLHDALRFALGANAHRGLRMTPEDKRNAVRLALAAFPDYSNRTIAEVCGVSRWTVGQFRKDTEERLR